MASPSPAETRVGPPVPLWQRARRAVGDVLTYWRRSIRTRVVVTIVLLGAVVAGSVGWLLVRQISDGLVQSRLSASRAEAVSQTASARELLGSAGSSDFDPATQLRQVAEALVARGKLRGYAVVVMGPIGPRAGGSPATGIRTTPGVSATSVPARLQRVVAARTSGTSWTYTRLRRLADPPGTGTPSVVVGSRIVLPSDGGTYALYYVFPMTEEQRTLNLVRQSLLTSGVLLLVLTAGIVLLVTRQVITPVRLARRVAERIASGRLEERMHVHGEDDIARLATSFNQMTDALQQQIRQLVELSRAQRQFVSDVSHELRTPLTTVRMAGDVLHDSRGSFEPVAARAAELLQKELDRFENLLADLLEISRFDAGAAGLELSEVNLADVARRVVDQAAAVARQRGVRIVVEASQPCVAEVDERRIERVLRNLVSNAIDHANVRDDARVVVRVACDEQAVAVTVRDYGVGLKPGQSAMVFNRFWRADPARARTTGGTGLGLAISLEDAQLHGGWLQVWGAPDAGAQFRLTVPLRAGDPLAHSPLPLVPDDWAGESTAPHEVGGVR
ncbi:MtrAB system histidine kinase MtrB [Nocardioides pocheonensis]|uniref:Sensor histidine kinase MtrB n=1 Tax=Nocardioides pocheonensis TaxID=661485 RepID=A0A3N0GM87_9ACTN|nr:MtrAB system histidine kinase MtrB [Nocardioides pocheonensis]RNM13594.1 sensor histidine kinase [Nocardioides pocheonensis]